MLFVQNNELQCRFTTIHFVNSQELNLKSAIFELTVLEHLDLGGNNLTYLPSDFSKLKKLNTLIVCECQIETISYDICYLENLKILDIFNNETIVLPVEIGNFPKTIYATFNYIEDFDELKCINSIQWIDSEPDEIDMYELFNQIMN